MKQFIIALFCVLVCCFSLAKADLINLVGTESKAAFTVCDKKNPTFSKDTMLCLNDATDDAMDDAMGAPKKCSPACKKVVSVLNTDPACQKASFAVCPFLKSYSKKTSVKATLATLKKICP